MIPAAQRIRGPEDQTTRRSPIAAFISRRVVTLTAVCYYPLAVLLGISVVVNANERSLAMEQAATLQTIGSKASYAGNSVLETITFGWYDAASRTPRA